MTKQLRSFLQLPHPSWPGSSAGQVSSHRQPFSTRPSSSLQASPPSCSSPCPSPIATPPPTSAPSPLGPLPHQPTLHTPPHPQSKPVGFMPASRGAFLSNVPLSFLGLNEHTKMFRALSLLSWEDLVQDKAWLSHFPPMEEAPAFVRLMGGQHHRGFEGALRRWRHDSEKARQQRAIQSAASVQSPSKQHRLAHAVASSAAARAQQHSTGLRPKPLSCNLRHHLISHRAALTRQRRANSSSSSSSSSGGGGRSSSRGWRGAAELCSSEVAAVREAEESVEQGPGGVGVSPAGRAGLGNLLGSRRDARRSGSEGGVETSRSASLLIHGSRSWGGGGSSGSSSSSAPHAVSSSPPQEASSSSSSSSAPHAASSSPPHEVSSSQQHDTLLLRSPSGPPGRTRTDPFPNLASTLDTGQGEADTEPALAACSMPHCDERLSFPSEISQHEPGSIEWFKAQAGLDHEAGADASSTCSVDGGSNDGSEGSEGDDALNGFGLVLRDDDAADAPLQGLEAAARSRQWGVHDGTDTEEEEEEGEEDDDGEGSMPEMCVLDGEGSGLEAGARELAAQGVPHGLAQLLLRAHRALQDARLPSSKEGSEGDGDVGVGAVAVFHVENGGVEEEDLLSESGGLGADRNAAFTKDGLVFNFWSKAPLG